MPVGKQCDFVWDKGGERIKLGRVSMNDVGHVEAQVSRQFKPEIMEQMFPVLEEYELVLTRRPVPVMTITDRVVTTTTTTHIQEP